MMADPFPQSITFAVTLTLTRCADAELNCFLCCGSNPLWQTEFRNKGKRVTVGVCEHCRASTTTIQPTPKEAEAHA
jgi:hypothetical protein